MNFKPNSNIHINLQHVIHIVCTLACVFSREIKLFVFNVQNYAKIKVFVYLRAENVVVFATRNASNLRSTVSRLSSENND